MKNLDKSDPSYSLKYSFLLQESKTLEFNSNTLFQETLDTMRSLIKNQLDHFLLKYKFQEKENFKIELNNFTAISRSSNKVTYSFNTFTNTYYYGIELMTTQFKESNVIDNNRKPIIIPLIKKGKSYYINVKIGKLIKTYILDSGASDMSIDIETYSYLSSTNMLKIEHRLSDARYQLADGSIIQLKRIKIPSFSINNIPFQNIVTTVVQNGKPYC